MEPQILKLFFDNEHITQRFYTIMFSTFVNIFVGLLQHIFNLELCSEPFFKKYCYFILVETNLFTMVFTVFSESRLINSTNMDFWGNPSNSQIFFYILCFMFISFLNMQVYRCLICFKIHKCPIMCYFGILYRYRYT